MKQYQMLIGGHWTDPAAGEWIDSSSLSRGK